MISTDDLSRTPTTRKRFHSSEAVELDPKRMRLSINDASSGGKSSRSISCLHHKVRSGRGYSRRKCDDPFYSKPGVVPPLRVAPLFTRAPMRIPYVMRVVQPSLSELNDPKGKGKLYFSDSEEEDDSCMASVDSTIKGVVDSIKDHSPSEPEYLPSQDTPSDDDFSFNGVSGREGLSSSCALSGVSEPDVQLFVDPQKRTRASRQQSVNLKVYSSGEMSEVDGVSDTAGILRGVATDEMPLSVECRRQTRGSHRVVGGSHNVAGEVVTRTGTSKVVTRAGQKKKSRKQKERVSDKVFIAAGSIVEAKIPRLLPHVVSPDIFVNLLKLLDDDQKQAVREIGLGALLHLSVSTLSGEFMAWLAKHFNWNAMALQWEYDGQYKELPINEDDVYLTFEFPRGPIPIVPALSRSENDPVFLHLHEEWKIYYEVELGQQAPKTAKMGIKLLGRGSGAEFKRDFFIFAVSSIIGNTQDKYANYRLLKPLADVSKIKELNLCQFVSDKLETSIRDFIDSPAGFFHGPLLLVMYNFFDRVTCGSRLTSRRFPLLMGWTQEKVAERVSREVRLGYGSGRVEDRLSFSRIRDYDIRSPAESADSSVDHSDNDDDAVNLASDDAKEESEDVVASDSFEEEQEQFQAAEDTQGDQTDSHLSQEQRSSGQELIDASKELAASFIKFGCAVSKAHAVFPSSPMISKLHKFTVDLEVDHCSQQSPSSVDVPVDKAGVKAANAAGAAAETTEPVVSVIDEDNSKGSSGIFFNSFTKKYELDPDEDALFDDSGYLAVFHFVTELQQKMEIRASTSRPLKNFHDPDIPTFKLLSSSDESFEDEPESDGVDEQENDTVAAVEDESEVNVEDESDDNESNNTSNESADCVPSSSSPVAGLCDRVLRSKRKPAAVKRSPFIQRIVSVMSTWHKDDKQVVEYAFSSFNEKHEVMYHDGHLSCSREDVASMSGNNKLSSAILDVWCRLLNLKEKKRSYGSPRRVFFSINAVKFLEKIENSKEDPVRAEYCLDQFMKRVDYELYYCGEEETSKNIDLVFFAIHQSDHYYVVCINMKSKKVQILDNRFPGNGISAADKYGSLPKILHQAFVSYMISKSDSRAAAVENYAIIVASLAWRCNSNYTDCGIFCMRHMEQFKGVLRRWDCGFKKGDVAFAKELRARYCAAILMDHENTVKDEVVKNAAGFSFY